MPSINDRDKFIFTLLNTHLKAGDKVLDIGCGMGDVSKLAFDIVGTNGKVIGIDNNEYFLNIAKEKYGKEIEFKHCDLLNLPSDLGEFNAIIGRRVLMYLPNPLNTINDLKTFLKPNGKLIFQESFIDIENKNKAFPISQSLLLKMKQTVLKENGDVEIGNKLYSIFKQADLKVNELKSEWILQYPENHTDLIFVYKAMLPRMKSFGLFDNMDTDKFLADLEHEWANASDMFYRDFAVGICGEKQCGETQ